MMLSRLHALDVVTYRAPLALHFVDGATGAVVAEGLRVSAWRHDPAAPVTARRAAIAARSPHSSIYGFRSLPGLERYVVGESHPIGSLPFVVFITDDRERYLPQMRLYNLPLGSPEVQEVTLFPTVRVSPPTGFGLIRGQLMRTTAPGSPPHRVSVLGPAAWARIIVEAPAPSSLDPDQAYHGFADERGRFALCVPCPPIANGVLLEDATCEILLAVEHEPADISADIAEIRHGRPALRELPIPPFQATLGSQSRALLFAGVRLVDADTQTYEVVSSVLDTELDLTLHYRRPLILRTQRADAPDSPLSEFLIRS